MKKPAKTLVSATLALAMTLVTTPLAPIASLATESEPAEQPTVTTQTEEQGEKTTPAEVGVVTAAETATAPSPITTQSATTTHSATAAQNGVTFTVAWNDAPVGEATTFHVTQTGGSSETKARMDVPTYWDTDNSQESVCDPTRRQWGSYYTLGTDGYDFTFNLTASGTYRINFYFMDETSGVWYLRTTASIAVNDPSRPSVTQIVNSAVAQCRQETDGSEYAMALWLHDWALDQLEYDHSLNYCSTESGLTRGLGTCESYQRIYAKLLNTAGIANGRVEGNGHTWNAVKIDGKWCQMDLTWDDTSDNWYGDLDQRHLYFGLTDELMAIAHSDHTKNYQAEGYAYRSADLSNNYFVRNGKADEWAEKYADRIQEHLDARETEFSIDADNQSFPPSISGIQNAIVAHAMNQQGRSVNDDNVKLTATSNVTTVTSYQWSAMFDFTASYAARHSITAMPSDCKTSSGTRASFAVEAPGASSFQWQCSDNVGISWYNTGIGGDTSKQPTLEFTASTQLAKRLYRCSVTFPDGAVLISDPAHLIIETQHAITAQPNDCAAAPGSTARFSVVANGASSFQWQCSDNAGKSWYDTGIGNAISRQATLEFEASAGLTKRLYRCVVSFSDGTKAATESARLKLIGNAIAGQPKDAVAATGSTTSFTVRAEGAASYRWQCSDNGGKTWYDTGIGNAASKQAALSFTANDALAKRLYRCIVVFADGTETASQSAKLTLTAQEGAITSQPKDCSTKAGERATFTVEAEHAKAYQWQCSDNGGKTWYDTGIGGATSKTSSISFTASEGLAKRLYRCMVTYKGGAKRATSTARLLLQ